MSGFVYIPTDPGSASWDWCQNRCRRTEARLMLKTLRIPRPSLLLAHLVVSFDLRLRHLFDVITGSHWLEVSETGPSSCLLFSLDLPAKISGPSPSFNRGLVIDSGLRSNIPAELGIGWEAPPANLSYKIALPSAILHNRILRRG